MAGSSAEYAYDSFGSTNLCVAPADAVANDLMSVLVVGRINFEAMATTAEEIGGERRRLEKSEPKRGRAGCEVSHRQGEASTSACEPAE